jgi:hypothetical protein
MSISRRRAATLIVPGRLPQRLAALIALALVIAGCVTDSRPSACDEGGITIDVQLTADAMTPSDPAVCRDQDVTLVVTSKVDGVIHIHGYDQIVPATEVTAGEDLHLSFVAERAGQFPIELHPNADPTGVSVGVFTVHEP